MQIIYRHLLSYRCTSRVIDKILCIGVWMWTYMLTYPPQDGFLNNDE